MRQKISHGATIDTATTSEVAALIAGMVDRKQVTEYRRYKGVIQLNAAGSGQSNNGEIVIPSQYDLLLERVSIGGGGAATTGGLTVAVYENDPLSDTNLLEIIVVGTVGKYSDSFSNRIYVTANSQVILTAGGTVSAANLQVTYNLQGRLIPAS